MAEVILTEKNYRKYLKLGTEVEIVDSTRGHNYGPVGSRFKVTNPDYSLDVRGISVFGLVPGGNHIYFNQFKLVNIKDEYTLLEESIKDMAIRRVAYKEAVDWMDEKGVDTLSPQKRSAIETKFKIKFYE